MEQKKLKLLTSLKFFKPFKTNNSIIHLLEPANWFALQINTIDGNTVLIT